MTIPEFIARCDRYCEATERSRVWLSKALLNDTYQLEKIAAGKADIGVKRLERAVEDLASLEAKLQQGEAA